MALLSPDDVRRLTNWYRDELTFLRWIGEAVADGDTERATALVGQRRDMVAAQIQTLAEAVGVDPHTPPTTEEKP